MTTCSVICSLAALKGIVPTLHNRCRYLLVSRSILHQGSRPMALHSNMWVTCPFHSPHFIYLALPAVTQFSEWQHSSSSSLSASINGYRCCPSAFTYIFLWRSATKSLYMWSSPILSGALVDIHDPSCNFPFFHPREALLVGCWVTTLPSLSCGVFFPSPPKEGSLAWDGTGTPVPCMMVAHTQGNPNLWCNEKKPVLVEDS